MRTLRPSPPARARLASIALVGLALVAAGLTSLLGCDDAADAGATGPTSSTSAASTTAASSSSATSSSASTGSGLADPCGDALLCDTFEGYAGTTSIDDNQELGFWRASVEESGGAMSLDGAHTVSGSKALHVRVDQGASAGGRLFASGAQPLFQGGPKHLYGKMQMYIDPNGPSVHWTFFGASGPADSMSPEAGRRATYLMSSLPKDDVNTFSFVYGLEASGGDPFHDCYYQSPTPMPSPGWTCVEFEMDGADRKLSMSIDGGATVAGSVDDHGQGCVGGVPGDSPWYGPEVDQVYVGAWSFHPMESPLEIWIDDVVVDTKPVACP
jgi:hypothetical protein